MPIRVVTQSVASALSVPVPRVNVGWPTQGEGAVGRLGSPLSREEQPSRPRARERGENEARRAVAAVRRPRRGRLAHDLRAAAVKLTSSRAPKPADGRPSRADRRHAGFVPRDNFLPSPLQGTEARSLSGGQASTGGQGEGPSRHPRLDRGSIYFAYGKFLKVGQWMPTKRRE
jgi:hypothetical protein